MCKCNPSIRTPFCGKGDCVWPEKAQPVTAIEHIRRKYKDRMLQLAFVVSGWSPEPEGQRHGCVLALEGKYIVATGFNGPDRSHKPDAAAKKCACPDHYPAVVHAEVNALLNLKMIGVESQRCVAYVTKKPCDPCMQALKNAGVMAVLWLQDVGEDRGQWIR